MLKWLAIAGAGTVLVLGAQPKTDPPLGYFASHCQRCHGENGVQYDPNLGKGKTDAWLVQEIKEMAEGPGQSPLDGEALKAQSAFHRALVRKEPFVFVAKLGGGAISGETLPATAITVIVGAKRVPAKVTEASWTAQIPASATAKTVSVEAKLKGKTVRLALAKAWYSHSEPLK